jgi:hypothetical protein
VPQQREQFDVAQERDVVRVDQIESLLDWRRSQFCSGGACVEVARSDSAYFVRDSKTAQSPVLSFTEAEWHAFAQGMRAGDFNFE